MNGKNRKTPKSILISLMLMKYTWLIVLIWTLIIALLLVRDLNFINHENQNLAIREARAHFKKDEAFRFWAATHGGFYVPVTERTHPNPYLSHIPERDLETPTGKQLTLMNPAWAVRQMNEDFAETNGVTGHITSLLPLRPENSPDNWERQALESFEKGESEALEFTDIDGQPFLRLMKPLITREGCLKCHAHQGYEVGDVRGGVSVSAPLASYSVEKNQHKVNSFMTSTLIWLVGFCSIILGSIVIIKKNTSREQAEKEIKHQLTEKEIILKEVHHRIKNNIASIGSLLSLQLQSLSNPEAISALQDAVGRVNSMQILYEKLLPTDDYQITSLKEYLNNLIDEIVRLFPANINITVEKRIDDIQLEPNRLFLIGIIVNELMTNTIKYGFTGRDSGSIQITVKEDNKNVILTIHDNGIGLPEEFDINKQKGFGLMLIKMLSNQLMGGFTINDDDGTMSTLEFQL